MKSFEIVNLCLLSLHSKCKNAVQTPAMKIFAVKPNISLHSF